MVLRLTSLLIFSSACSVASRSSRRLRFLSSPSRGIETGHEAFTGKIRRMNLRQVLLIEQRQLQVLLINHVGAPFLTAQGRDPTHAGMPFQFINLGLS